MSSVFLITAALASFQSFPSIFAVMAVLTACAIRQPAGIIDNPKLISESGLDSTNAADSIAAVKTSANVPSAIPWSTHASSRANSAAIIGFPGKRHAHISDLIHAPLLVLHFELLNSPDTGGIKPLRI